MIHCCDMRHRKCACACAHLIRDSFVTYSCVTSHSWLVYISFVTRSSRITHSNLICDSFTSHSRLVRASKMTHELVRVGFPCATLHDSGVLSLEGQESRVYIHICIWVMESHPWVTLQDAYTYELVHISFVTRSCIKNDTRTRSCKLPMGSSPWLMYICKYIYIQIYVYDMYLCLRAQVTSCQPDLCHTYEWVLTHVTHMKKSCRIYILL